MTDIEPRKLHNGYVLSGQVIDHSDDGRGRRLIVKDGRVFMFDDAKQTYREVQVLATKFVENGYLAFKGKQP